MNGSSLTQNSWMECTTIKSYISVLIVIFGTFGNMTSFAVLNRRSMTRIATYVYLAALSLADEGVLIFSLLRKVIDHLVLMELGYERIQFSNFPVCFFSTFLSFIFAYLSVWIVVVVTVERALAITLPFKVSTISRPTRNCDSIIDTVLNYWDMILYFAAPFFIVFVANICIIIGVNWARKKRYFMAPSSVLDSQKNGQTRQSCGEECCLATNSGLPDESYEADLPGSGSLWKRKVSRRGKKCDVSNYSRTVHSLKPLTSTPVILRQHSKKKSSRGRSRETRQLSILLIGISLLFLLLTGPYTIAYYFFSSIKLSCGCNTATELFMYLNHSTNFLLYCAMGHRFRRQLYKLFASIRMALFCSKETNRIVRPYIHRVDIRNPAQLIQQTRKKQVVGECYSFVKDNHVSNPLPQNTQMMFYKPNGPSRSSELFPDTNKKLNNPRVTWQWRSAPTTTHDH
ncbi:hypothetical protein Ciccas_008200 [Cichlidogyrus casuarinus]|uniref:G-protein coupled receptors family 1 profile domain-containing protein n=1 Tax=Cichlidogyrus casuarinus TaxID=1844966 RepID=A0ABD2Q0M5_9PLAT